MQRITYISILVMATSLLSITFYSIYIGFGNSSVNLKDTFEENET